MSTLVEAVQTSEIQVTPAALQEMLRLREKRHAEGKPTHALRIGIRGGGCTGYAYLFEWADNPARDRDRVFALTPELSLYVDPKSLVLLRGMELDFVRSLMGYGFKFNNPNAKGACGCGDSVQF